MLKNVVRKHTFFFCSVWKHHSTSSMLYTSFPVPIVHTSIYPYHFPLAASLVMLVLALIYIAACPLEHSLSMALVLEVLPFVRITLRLSWAAPLTKSVLHSIFKIAGVNLTCLPCVLAFTMRLAIAVFSGVCVSRTKGVCSCAVLQAKVPFALIPITVWPRVDSISMSSWFVPFTVIRVIINALPDAIPMLKPMVPLAVVHFSICPCVNSFAVGLAFLELPIVRIVIRISFKTFAIPEILCPLSLILAPVFVLHGSLAMPLTVLYLTNEYSFWICAFHVAW